ncbi:MAG: SDR family oxidoreductase [Planctomycetes bacterium]|nr:SDR family oxidoreductase [Planctomycetota bacterium]
MARFLVTGGAGFIGSHIVQALISRGDEVRVLDDLSSGREENLAGLDPGDVGSGAALELLRGDVADPDACARACEGVAGVFHEAAVVSVPRSVEEPLRTWEVNSTGTLHLLEAARGAGVSRMVFAASSAAYGESETLPKIENMPVDPRSPYAASKVAGEGLLAAYGISYGMQTVSLRYFNVFGPRQLDDSPYTGVIAIFARCLLDGTAPTIYGDGRQTRDFTYVDNVVQANLAAMEREVPAGSVINVGGGERVSLLDLYRAMAEALGSDLEPVFTEERAGDVRHSLADIQRLKELLDLGPGVPWREGLRRTLEWYQAVREGDF